MKLVEFEGTEGGVYWLDPDSVVLVRHATKQEIPKEVVGPGIVIGYPEVPDEHNSIILIRGSSILNKVKGSVSQVMMKLSEKQ